MTPRIAVFAYNFPHRKTQDFLLRLFVEGYGVDTVIAADPVKLDIPASAVRTKLRHGALVHPRTVAERIGARYVVAGHNGPECLQLLQSERFDVGVVSGARILRAPVIDSFGKGIINFHPGLIPESRGLDAMLWSIYRDIPLGVTSHLIDARVDAGTVLLRRTIPVHADDTILDLSERLNDTQLEMLAPSIERALAGGGEPVGHAAPYNRKMPASMEEETLRSVGDYVSRHSVAPRAQLVSREA